MDYYSAIKSNIAVIHGTMLTNIKNIMLSEGSKTQKVTHCIISFIWNIQNKYIHRDRNQIGGCQGLEVGVGEVTT